jgi:2'-5' RNA ligase
MVHSIELLFDGDTEAAIRSIWDDLATADMPSRAPAGRPHVTLAVAERIAPEVDALLRPVAQRLPLACTVGAPLLFGRSNAVLARLIVPTAELLALHAEVHRTCGPYLLPDPLPNSLPGQWTPHVTVARRVGGAQLEQAFRLAGRRSEIHGTVAGLRRWDGTDRVEHPIS